MKYFIVRYLHTDFAGWKEYLIPHLQYIQEHLKAGDLLLSGPLQDCPADKKEAVLVFRVEDRDALQAQIEKDPYWTKGLVADYTVREWNPMFGLLGASADEIEAFAKKLKELHSSGFAF